MRTRRAPSPHLAFTLVTTLLVSTACTGGDAAGSADATARGAATSPDAGTAAPADDRSTTPERRPNPLTAFLVPGGGQGPTAEQEAAAARERQAYEQAIADCMATQGFTYEVAARDAGAGADAGIWGLPRDEFVATYGYGITTISPAEAGGARGANGERLEAMSPAERTAYHRALYGDALPLDDDGYVVRTREPVPAAPDDATPGCAMIASQSVEADDGRAAPTSTLDRFQPLRDDMQQLWERVDDDPRVRAAAATWAGCMADAGFPGHEWPDDPEAEVVERLGALTTGAVDPAGETVGLPALDDAAERDPQAVEELRDFELEIAAADHACIGPFADVRYDVQVEVEQDFVDEHRDQLEAYRDAMAAVTGAG